MTGNIFPDGWTLTGKFISWLTVGEPTGKLFHPWRCCTDRESLKFRWQFSDRREKLKVSLTFLGCQGKSSLTADWAVYLSWQFLPLVNSKWRFSVRETRLSVTFFCWQLIPDGNHHRWPFLTVLVLFLTEETVRKKLSWGSGGRAATVVEDHVPFLVESELFLGHVRCRPVEKCSPRWSHKQGQLVRMVIYWNMFLSYNLMDIWQLLTYKCHLQMLLSSAT